MKRCKSQGFTIAEIMIVVAVISILVLIATPCYFKARKESHRSTCMSNMRKIEGAKALYSMSAGSKPTASWEDILPYIMRIPTCPSGGQYEGWDIGTSIYCTIHDWRNNPEYAGFIP